MPIKYKKENNGEKELKLISILSLSWLLLDTFQLLGAFMLKREQSKKGASKKKNPA